MDTVTPQELKALLLGDEEFALIDVREQGAFSESHLLFAVCIPLSRLELETGDLIPRPDTRIILIGALIIVAGALLLSNSLGYTSIDVPAAIGSVVGIGVIVGGLLLIWNYRRRLPEPTEPERLPDTAMRRWRILGDMHVGQEEWALEDMDLESWIGDVRLDLTQARLEEGERVIKIFSLIGDVDMFVPRALPVAVEVNNVLGKIALPGKRADGFFRWLSFTSPDYHSAAKRVSISIRSIIGDVNIRHVG